MLLTGQFSEGTISGVSHRSVHYSYRMDQIARRLVVTFWRATMIGLRRKNILTYLTPDDHMMGMWQKNYVLRVDNWKKQWSGCSKTLQISARSSNSIGHRLRRSLLGLRNGRGLRRRQFLDVQGSRTGSSIGRCLKPLYVRMVGTTSRQLCSCFLTWTGMPST